MNLNCSSYSEYLLSLEKSTVIISIFEEGAYYKTSCLAFSNLSWFLLTIKMLNPYLARIFEKARPMPSDAPVIRAQDFSS